MGSDAGAAANPQGAKDGAVVTVGGSLSFGGAMPAKISALVAGLQNDGSEQISRSAFPKAPSSGLTYTVYALEDLPAGSTDTPLRYEGTVADDNSSYTVGIPVTSGKKYYVHAVAKSGGVEVFSGKSALLDFTADPNKFYANCDIALGASQTSGKKGCVQLAVNVQGAGVSSARMIYKGAGSEINVPGKLKNGSVMMFNVGINDDDEPDPANGLASGAYLFAFEFYSEAYCAGNLLYSFKESVNVFDNLVTDSWVKIGAEPWLTSSSSGTACKVTAAMVEGFGLTDIFVDPNADDDSGSGTFLHPKKTFAVAVGMLLNENADYTIYIKGTVEGGQTIPSTISAKSLTLCGASPLPTTGADAGIPQDIIDARKVAGKSALLIEKAVPITIENLKITGGMGTVDGGLFYGGGICLKAEGGSLTLASGAYVSENKAKAESETNKGRGAGICLYPACRLNILDGAVIEKNESDGAGGGIFCKSTSDKKAVITMSGGHIRGNTAATNGGALNMGYGTFTMTGGVIGDVSESISQAAKYGDDERKSAYSNTARLGGAISSSGTGSGNLDIYLLGGTIAYNCAQDNGGAIYLGGCNMTVKNAKIQYNGAGGSPGGGAFCFGNDADLHLEDCSIIGNECYGEGALGGAICVLGSSPTGGTSKIYLKGSVSIPSNDALKNDIVLKKYSGDGAGYWIHPALTIEGKLTGSGKIARLTPTSDDYDDMYRRVVLKLASGVTDTSLANEAYKFDVTPQTSPAQEWMVGFDGKLTKLTTFTADNIESFRVADFNEGDKVVYAFDSTVTDTQIAVFTEKLYHKTTNNNPDGKTVGEGSVLDFSKATNLTSLGFSWSNNGVFQPFDIILPPNFDTTKFTNQTFAWAIKNAKNVIATPKEIGGLVSEDGVVYNKNKTTLFFYPGGKTATSFVVPDGVTTIPRNSFSYNSSLKNITLPEGVTSIAWNACCATSIESINVPSTVKTIANEAFSNSASFTSLTFANPNGWKLGPNQSTAVEIAPSNLSDPTTAATWYKTNAYNVTGATNSNGYKVLWHD